MTSNEHDNPTTAGQQEEQANGTTQPDADVDSVIRTHEFLDAWLRRCHCGELNYWFPKNDLPQAIRSMSRDGIHQVGTTRIAANSAVAPPRLS